MLRVLILSLMVTLGLAQSAYAVPIDAAALTSKAVAAYDAGDYEVAADQYEQLIAAGHVNGHVYYNLGNAYYRMGEMGAATAAYLASARFLPRSPDVTANLSYARKDAVDQLDVKISKPWWAIPAFWSDYFSVKELAYSAALSVGLGSLIWLLGWFIPGGAVGFRFAGIGAWVLALVIGYGMAVKGARAGVWGAVSVSTVQVYSGPSERNNKNLFELHEAAPVLIQQAQGEWAQIVISDGKKGWIKRSSLKVY